MRLRSLHKWSWRANEPFKQSRSIIMLYLAFSILRKISRRCAKYTRARSRPPSVCATISIDDNSIYTSNKEAEALHSAQDGDNKSVWTNADIRCCDTVERTESLPNPAAFIFQRVRCDSRMKRKYTKYRKHRIQEYWMYAKNLWSVCSGNCH